MRVQVPSHLDATVGTSPGGSTWIRELPERVSEIASRWSLSLGDPIQADATCSWVAPVTRPDGGAAVLKLGFPHMEATHEIDGLAFWDGDPSVRLLDCDRAANALLLERCAPGVRLRERPEAEQDEVIAAALRRLWRAPRAPHPFRPLSEMADYWCQEVRRREDEPLDAALLDEGLCAFEELAASRTDAVLLATDLHAGNVLSAEREPWLVIDPKPFVGDPCYDVTQHLMNCRERMSDDPLGLVARMAHGVGVDEARVRRWTFARFALEARRGAEELAQIASRLAS